MPLPREILPGRTYLITRRCTQRQFLLRPDTKTNSIFAYCLAEAAQRHAIDLIAWSTMSNHYHAVVHDPLGRLPAFLERFHLMVAKALNVRWSRWESVWSREETSVVRLVAPSDVFDKVVYALANPIADDLVDRIGDWPGCSSLHHLGGGRTMHERPKSYFRITGSTMPDRVELRAVLPAGVSGSESGADWAARVREAVALKERTARDARLREGRRVMGRKAVLSASAFDAPMTSAPRRELRPNLACKDGPRRVVELAKMNEFRRAHVTARLRFIGGERDVEFPAGTYRMRALGARCAPFPNAA